MQPAFSVIFLTTLIGAAQGLFLALFGTDISGLGGLAPLESQRILVSGSVLALVLSALGLLASFFHLGRPERAWRSASMWRTSWLSREVIALPLFMLGLFLYAIVHATGQGNPRLVGAFTTLACIALFVCTAMIYASVRFLQEWASPLTLINYLLLGCASGLMLATLLAALSGVPTLVQPYGTMAAGLTVLAGITRSLSLYRNARLKPKSTLQSAIGIKHPRIVQKAQGFMGGSFNTREFFHGRSKELMSAVKWGFLILTFPMAIALLAIGLIASSTQVLFIAFVTQYIGLLAERWFFFAQANHPQNLYYQNIS
jgi:DMSO reductase anchor subunit